MEFALNVRFLTIILKKITLAQNVIHLTLENQSESVLSALRTVQYAMSTAAVPSVEMASFLRVNSYARR